MLGKVLGPLKGQDGKHLTSSTMHQAGICPGVSNGQSTTAPFRICKHQLTLIALQTGGNLFREKFPAQTDFFKIHFESQTALPNALHWQKQHEIHFIETR